MVQSGTKWCEAYVVLLQNQTDYLTVVNILFINLKFLVIMKIKLCSIAVVALTIVSMGSVQAESFGTALSNTHEESITASPSDVFSINRYSPRRYSSNNITIGVGYVQEALDMTLITVNMNGFYLGGAYNLEVANGFGVELGVKFLYAAGNELETKFNKMDLQIPINVNYGFDISSNAKVVLLVGPAISYGLSYKINESDGYEGIERFNLYLGFGARLVLGQFGVNVNYDLGLLDLNKEKFSLFGADFKCKENRFCAGVSYSF